MSLGKILLVDDSPSVRIMLEDKLTEDGYTVYCAENGMEAIEIMAIASPDIVITDVSMPEMDGFALCRTLKQRPETHDIPIIMLTAATEEKDVVEGLGLGIQDYIRKPFSPAELLLRVQNILKTSKEKCRLKDVFARHASPEVVEMLLTRSDDLALGGEIREVTVLFADIRGFTQMASGASPKEIVQVLNEYLTVMSEPVIAEGGILDKYLGDGIMAVFGAPLSHDDDEARAVRSSIQMQKEIIRVNRERSKDGHVPVGVGVGISSGPALVGNIGSPRRTDYTAIGDCVNVAARLQAVAQGGKIIISEEVYNQVHDKVSVISLEPVMVQGKAEPIKIYSVEI